MNARKQHGFSLIELLIVVAIILIIAAIAVPNLLRAQMSARQSSAVGSIRTINTAAVNYSTTYPNVGFPPNLSALGGILPCTASSTSACMIDDVLSTGTKSGYTFTWTGDGNTPSVGYTILATPVSLGSSGQNQYCSDPSGVIRFSTTGTGCAVTSSPALQ